MSIRKLSRSNLCTFAQISLVSFSIVCWSCSWGVSTVSQAEYYTIHRLSFISVVSAQLLFDDVKVLSSIEEWYSMVKKKVEIPLRDDRDLYRLDAFGKPLGFEIIKEDQRIVLRIISCG